MDNDLRKQIYDSMNLKDTDVLLDIWQSNNRAEWSAAAFEVVQEILTKRIGELPPQDEISVTEDEEGVEGEDDQSVIDGLRLEKWEAKLIDSEGQPDFYDTWDVIDLI